MISIFQHTPIWVWILFVFLLHRGIQALRPREMKLLRMLLLPVLFFVWAVVSIMVELQKLYWGYSGFLISIVLGFGLGWKLWRKQASEVTFDQNTRIIKRPGSPWTLILILFAFVAKFILQVFLGYTPDLRNDAEFNFIFGAISGLVDGIFWGGTAVLLQVLRTKKNIEQAQYTQF